MKGQVLSIYLHGFLLRSLPLLELLELRRIHSPLHTVRHHQLLGVLLALHLSLSTSIGSQLLTIHGTTFEARAFRGRRRVVSRCR
jgi:hypothetical protein